jgi:hypothetical protein
VSTDGFHQKTTRHKKRFQASPRRAGSTRGHALKLLLPPIAIAMERAMDSTNGSTRGRTVIVRSFIDYLVTGKTASDWKTSHDDSSEVADADPQSGGFGSASQAKTAGSDPIVAGSDPRNLPASATGTRVNRESPAGESIGELLDLESPPDSAGAPRQPAMGSLLRKGTKRSEQDRLALQKQYRDGVAALRAANSASRAIDDEDVQYRGNERRR